MLADFSNADLEDLKWFAESVVKVEAELREVWLEAVKKWRESVEILFARNLHRYILSSQPERVSRWLLLRTPAAEMDDLLQLKAENSNSPTNKPAATARQESDTATGLLGLGITQQEVEVLFANETADDINRCVEKMAPFLSALENRDKLFDIVLVQVGGPDGKEAVYEALEQSISVCINDLQRFAAESQVKNIGQFFSKPNASKM